MTEDNETPRDAEKLAQDGAPAPAGDAASTAEVGAVQDGAAAPAGRFQGPAAKRALLAGGGVLLLGVIGFGLGSLFSGEDGDGEGEELGDEAVLTADGEGESGSGPTDGAGAPLESTPPSPSSENESAAPTAPRAALDPAEHLRLALVALGNDELPLAEDHLRDALDRVPNAERVLRGRILETLAQVKRRTGEGSAARIFERQAQQLLEEVLAPARLLEVAKGRTAAGDLRGAQNSYHRFMLVSGGQSSEARSLRAKAEMELGEAYAEERATTLSERDADRVDAGWPAFERTRPLPMQEETPR